MADLDLAGGASFRPTLLRGGSTRLGAPSYSEWIMLTTMTVEDAKTQ